jgi:hypothetical protein
MFAGWLWRTPVVKNGVGAPRPVRRAESEQDDAG